MNEVKTSRGCPLLKEEDALKLLELAAEWTLAKKNYHDFNTRYQKLLRVYGFHNVDAWKTQSFIDLEGNEHREGENCHKVELVYELSPQKHFMIDGNFATQKDIAQLFKQYKTDAKTAQSKRDKAYHTMMRYAKNELGISKRQVDVWLYDHDEEFTLFTKRMKLLKEIDTVDEKLNKKLRSNMEEDGNGLSITEQN